MGLTNQLSVALAAEVASIAGIATASTPVDSIPETPFLYVGDNKGNLIGGSWEEKHYVFQLHCAITRVTEDRDQQAINDLLDQIIAAFRTGIYLGGLGIAQLLTWDTAKFFTLGETDYQSIDFDCEVFVYSAQTYTG